jgi:hypothetical protein
MTRTQSAANIVRLTNRKGKNMWVKIDTGMRNDIKIKLLRNLQDGDSMVLFFVMLCGIAMEGASAVLKMSGNGKPMTPALLAVETNMSTELVTRALTEFENLGMVYQEGGFWVIENFEKHQSLDSLQNFRTKQAGYKRAYRAKNKAEAEGKEQHESESKPAFENEKADSKTSKPKAEKTAKLDNKSLQFVFNKVWDAYPEEARNEWIPGFSAFKAKVKVLGLTPDNIDEVASSLVAKVNDFKANDKKWLEGFAKHLPKFFSEEIYNSKPSAGTATKQQGFTKPAPVSGIYDSTF